MQCVLFLLWMITSTESRKCKRQSMLDERGAIWYFALEMARRRGMSEESKSSTGLESNIAGLLSYVLGWITGLIFFLLEEKDEYVRYHAMQSIIVFGAVTVVEVVLEIFQLIPYVDVVFLALQALVGLFAFVLWVVLMVKAYQGVRYKLPWAGELAERYSARK